VGIASAQHTTVDDHNFPSTATIVQIDRSLQGDLVPGISADVRQTDMGLVRDLDLLVRQLWQISITDVYVDGSFVEDKDRPRDIDGYFLCNRAPLASGRLEEQMNRIDPLARWTWNGTRRKWDEESRKRLFD